jgi:hypothetical protein
MRRRKPSECVRNTSATPIPQPSIKGRLQAETHGHAIERVHVCDDGRDIDLAVIAAMCLVTASASLARAKSAPKARFIFRETQRGRSASDAIPSARSWAAN